MSVILAELSSCFTDTGTTCSNEWHSHRHRGGGSPNETGRISIRGWYAGRLIADRPQETVRVKLKKI